jgi:hypothetical protein
LRKRSRKSRKRLKRRKRRLKRRYLRLPPPRRGGRSSGTSSWRTFRSGGALRS